MNPEKILRMHQAAAYYSAMCLCNGSGGVIVIVNAEDAHHVSQQEDGSVSVETLSDCETRRTEIYPTSVDFATAYGVRA